MQPHHDPSPKRPRPVGPSALDRIVYIHSCLANGDHFTATSLAEKLGVSPRTIQRDIEALRDRHGAEIQWEPSTGTYFCERPSEHLPLLRLSADEATAIALANKTFAAWGGSPLGRALTSALTKLADVVGNTVSIPVDALSDCIFQQDEGSADTPRRHFARLLEAIRRRQTLRLNYQKPGQPAPEERIVQPLHLAFLDHEWTLVAYAPDRDALRQFLLTRISEIHSTSTQFSPPADFDPKQYLSGAFGRYVGGQLQHVRLRFDSYAAPYLREKHWHPSQVLRELPDGTVEVALQVTHLLDVQRWVLSWGAHAEALDPDELRANVAREIRLLAKRYQ